jgi:transposase
LVKAVLAGASQTDAARLHGVSLRAANKWMALHKAGGIAALRLARRGRRSGDSRLNLEYKERVRRMIISSSPDQLKLPFHLWSRTAVARLIELEYGICLSVTTVARYLRSWGFDSRMPMRRANRRGKPATGRWIRQQYPILARRAKREEAVIYWVDNRGLRADRRTGIMQQAESSLHRRGCLDMISASSNRLEMAFMMFHGKPAGLRFVRFLRRMLKHARSKKVFLLVGANPVYRSVPVKRFLESSTNRLLLVEYPSA